MNKISVQYPPNYEHICRVIPAVRKNKNIVFTYGDTVYNPANNPLDDALLAHEQVHTDRQSNPDEWWDRYLKDVQFRLDEEVAAYRVQYQYAVKHYGRAERRRLLTHIASDLSGAMYGKIINKFQATMLITNEVKGE